MAAKAHLHLGQGQVTIPLLFRKERRSPRDGRIAQLVEQWTENPRVPSSILGPATFVFDGDAVKPGPFGGSRG